MGTAPSDQAVSPYIKCDGECPFYRHAAGMALYHGSRCDMFGLSRLEYKYTAEQVDLSIALVPLWSSSPLIRPSIVLVVHQEHGHANIHPEGRKIIHDGLDFSLRHEVPN